MFDTFEVADDLDIVLQVDFCRSAHGSPKRRTACTRALLETLLPGDGLGGLLGSVDPAGLDMHDLVSYLGGCERQAGWVAARQLVAVRELSGRRLVAGPHGEPADTALGDGAVNEFAADEVAAVLSLSRLTGQKRVWLASALRRLPATEAALARGALNLSKTWAIAEGLSVLDDAAAVIAEARVLGRAPHQTLGLLRASIGRAVLAADPSTAKVRAEKSHTERRVELTPRAEGMCEFWALLPAAEAMALWAAVTALADKARAADRAAANQGRTTGAEDQKTNTADRKGGADAEQGDEPTAPGADAEQNPSDGDGDGAADAGGDPDCPGMRTMDQARADVLADLADAVLARADLPRSHHRRPHIAVTVAASTLLGLDDQPGELAGYGPITAQTARRVAAEGTWRRLLTDPATGGLLDYGRTTYQPPANLTDHVITRDQTCRGPGCRIAAERCDIDHTIRFPDGPTADHNLTCECRRCHTRKHEAGWTLKLLPNGDVIWTSPTGHTYHDPVPPVLDTAVGQAPRTRSTADEVPPF